MVNYLRTLFSRSPLTGSKLIGWFGCTCLSLGSVSEASIEEAPPEAPPEIAHVFPDFAGTHLLPEAHLHLVVTGEAFTSDTRFYGWAPGGDAKAIRAAIASADFPTMNPPSSPPDDAVRIPVVDLDGQVAVLPQRDLASGLVGDHSVVWAVNSGADASEPYLIHVAKPFWVSDTRGVAGNLVYIFGFGIAGDIALRREDGQVWFPRSLSSARSPRYNDPNLVHFHLPSETPKGTYTVYVHNGRGGIYGWRPAGRLEVVAPPPAPARVNVRDFGATGTGESSDWAAIRDAMAAAFENGGGVVHFPPGTYRVERTVEIPQGVQLLGSGQEQSIIEGFRFDPRDAASEWWAPSAAAYSVLVMHDHTRLQDMGVRGSVSQGSGGYGMISGASNPYRITIRGCRIHSPEEDLEDGHYRYRAAMVFRNGRYVSFLENDITGSLEMRPFAYRNDLINNTFRRGTLMDMSSVMMPGAKNLVDANRFVDTPGRLAIFRGYRNYIRYNEIHNLGRGGWTNVPEPFLFHGGASQTTGTATAAQVNSLIDTRQEWRPGELRGATVLIYAGRGKGQYRIVTGNNANTLELDQVWRVVPDETSKYSVGMKITDNGIFNNQNHNPGYLSLWLDVIGNFVEKHRHSQGLGFYIYGDDRSRRSEDGQHSNVQRFHPSWYNVISNSWADGTPIILQGSTHQNNLYEGVPLFANMIAHNKVRQPHLSRSPNLSHHTVVGGLQLRGGGGRAGASHTMILGNQISNTGVGLLTSGSLNRTFVIGNRFHEVEAPAIDRSTSGPIFIDNIREIIGPGGVERQRQGPDAEALDFFEIVESAESSDI